MKLLHFESIIDHVKWLFSCKGRAKAGQKASFRVILKYFEIKMAFRYYRKQIDSMLPCVWFSNWDLEHRGRWMSRTFAGSDFSSVVSCCYGYTVRLWWKVTSKTQFDVLSGDNAEKRWIWNWNIAVLRRWFDVIRCDKFITFSVVLTVMSSLQVSDTGGDCAGQNRPSRLVCKVKFIWTKVSEVLHVA